MLKSENLPKTNSTKSQTQIFLAKIQRNEHTPEFAPVFFQEGNLSGLADTKSTRKVSAKKTKDFRLASGSV